MGLTNGGRDHLAKIMYNASGQVQFTNANAHIGVGNSASGFAVTQTDLLGGSKARKAMNAGFPKQGTNPQDIQAQSTFGTSEGNFAWEEWGFFNASSGGVMFSRTIQQFNGGAAKTAAESWQITIDLTINNP
jgi:hypothetical protein